MNRVFKFLAGGMMLLAFVAVPAFAQQQEECAALYEQKFLPNFKGTLAQRKTAVEAGDQYIAKCATLDADITKYLEKVLPGIKKRIDFEETVAAFDNAVKDAKTVNADVAFSSGKRLLSDHDPNLVDVMLVLASVGFDKAVAKPAVNTYNADAVNFAKQAIQKIEGGTASKQYGAWAYTYKTKDNALAWMNYTIGYITYFNQNNKKEALPYLYKATKFEVGKDSPKNNPAIYQAIGDFYKDEYNRLDTERESLAKQAEGKTPEEVKALADKAKELLLLQKGYADRMIDAYGRAYNLAGTDKAYKDSLYDTLKVLYGFRYDGKPSTPLDSHITSLNTKPMPDPTTTVSPVVDTTTTTTATTPTSSTSSLPTTTPASTTTTNARTSTTDVNATKQATTTKAKTAPKTPAKTPAPKKKGTR